MLEGEEFQLHAGNVVLGPCNGRCRFVVWSSIIRPLTTTLYPCITNCVYNMQVEHPCSFAEELAVAADQRVSRRGGCVSTSAATVSLTRVECLSGAFSQNYIYLFYSTDQLKKHGWQNTYTTASRMKFLCPALGDSCRLFGFRCVVLRRMCVP